jgi:type IV secretory pathway VirB10-like protein
MVSNRLAFVLLAVACVSAAAGGGYLATRQNAVPTPAAAQSATPATAPAAAAAAVPERPAVQETEAIVGDSAPKRAPEPPTAAPAAPKRSAEPVRTAKPTRRNTPETTSARREQAPALTSTWPSSAASQTPVAPLPQAAEPPAPVEERTVTEPARAPEPPRPTFEELVVSRDSVIGLETENRISSDTARVEDRVDARVTRDVRVGDRVAIPAGSRVTGTVTQVDRGGKFKEQARLGIRFHTIVLADGTRLPISTETIVRVGDPPNSASKIGGGAVGGAILGAILGGAKGAAIGATAGAGAGTAVVQAGKGSEVVLAPGTPLTARILSPVTVTIEKN